MYKVLLNGDVLEYKRFKNSYRGAYLIWRNMGKRYLGDELYLDNTQMKKYFSTLDLDDYDENAFWDLVGQKAVPIEDRIVISMTFDNTVIKRENFQRLIEAMESYSKKFEDPGHVPEYVDALKDLLDEEILGICWNQTDTNVDVWKCQYKFNDNGEEIEGFARPFNLKTDTYGGRAHAFLFEKSYIDLPPLDNLEKFII